MYIPSLHAGPGTNRARRIMPSRSVARDLALAAAAAMGLCLAVYAVLSVPPTLLIVGLLLVLTGAGLLAFAAHWLPAGVLGAGNRVTLGRAVLAIPVLALAPFPEALTEAGRWLVVTLAGLVLALDGVDGWVARRSGTVGEFGARFDMELDALLLLGLSVLVWQTGQVGVWVLLIGGMRYAFVAAAWLLPWMQQPLPPSFRRKTACVVQGVVLVAILVPWVPVWLATVAAAAALACLAGSFVADIRWLALARNR